MRTNSHQRGQEPEVRVETARRLRLAERVVAEVRAQWGEHLLAGGVYGSVAHAAARRHSDVEIVLLTDAAVAYEDDYSLLDGVLVERTSVPLERMLRAARRVGPRWGIEADQYRHVRALYDPSDLFGQVRAASLDLPAEAFGAALVESWWGAYELRGKLLNALQEGDAPRAVATGWEAAYAAAMRIALYERQPYESGRTLWRDVVGRGYGMPALVTALTEGCVERLAEALETVWRATGGWGAPDGWEPPAAGD